VPPTDPVHDRVELPEPPVIVAGVSEQTRPVLGEVELVSVTVPVNPVDGVTVIGVLTATPGVVLRMVVPAEIWKSTTRTAIVGVVWLSPGLDPVTVTV
jgi:hypothetical protein